MKKEVISLCIRIGIPKVSEPPIKILSRWRHGSKKASATIHSKLKAVVATELDFKKKVAEGLLKHAPRLFNPYYISQKGGDYQSILSKQREELLKSAPRYFKHLEEMYQTINRVPAGKYKKRIDKTADTYFKGVTNYLLPFVWSKYPQKNVVALAIMALTGQPKLQHRFLKETDKIISGSPVSVIRPEKTGEFKKALNNQIIKSGASILKMLKILELLEEGFDTLLCIRRTFPTSLKTVGKTDYPSQITKVARMLDSVISKENKVLNQLVERYRVKGFATFRSVGQSHIDFVLTKELSHELQRNISHLHLDIQVAQ